MKKIVVAESSPTIKSVADNLLRQNGYEVVCTSDGLQAWEVINSERPDLVLTGLNISGITGLELCRQISGDNNVGGIPVVIMVGAKDNVDEDAIRSAGARGKLKKPFSPRDVLIIVKKLIGEGSVAGQPEQAAGTHSRSTSYNAQVLSTTKHLENSENEVYNLDWTDLNDTGAKNPKTASNVRDSATADDQEIEIIEDQFDLASLNKMDEERPEPAARASDDEDYDWFIGEMKKDVSSDTGSIKTGSKASGDKNAAPERPAAQSGKSAAPRSEIQSDNATIFEPGAENAAETVSTANAKNASARTDGQHISDEEISKIADKVTQNLASAIAANIDSQKIIEAIKSVIKQ